MKKGKDLSGYRALRISFIRLIKPARIKAVQTTLVPHLKFVNFGIVQSISDMYLYYMYNGNNVFVLGIYVDNLLDNDFDTKAAHHF